MNSTNSTPPIILKGKYSTAKIFTSLVDSKSISQVTTILNQPFSQNQTIRLMPDIHAGAGCTIGTTMTITNKVCPNLVGVDIGCGMLVNKLNLKQIDLPLLDKIIHEYIPSGFDIHSTPHQKASLISLKLSELKCASKLNLLRAYQSIGTLGGGNHFIELDKDESDNLYLVIHTGSRYLGKEVATYYQNKAIDNIYNNKKQKQELIQYLKQQHREKEIQSALSNFPKSNVPKELCYLEDSDFNDYIHDMKIIQSFADLNRETIAYIIITELKKYYPEIVYTESFCTKHNYIDTDAMILRKGAVSAKKNELLIIPINMRDGSLICKGKGNPDWNYSAPHGAGRIMSRSQAKEQISLSSFQDSMKDVYSTSVTTSTIDESPMAYKPINSIIDNIHDTVDIISIIKPVYNFKAS